MSRTWVLRFRAIDKASFEDIKAGRKTVETRRAGPRYQSVESGDSLKLVCGNDQIVKRIRQIKRFASIEALFAEVPFEKVMPDLTSPEDALKIYHSWYKGGIKEYGLLAFYLD